MLVEESSHGHLEAGYVMLAILQPSFIDTASLAGRSCR